MIGEIHPLAHVDETSRVSPSVTIWQFASVTRGAIIDPGTSVGANATIDGAKIGTACRIQSGARLFAGVVLQDFVFIGPNVVICNDGFPSADGSGFYRHALADKPCVVVEHGASICANAVILPGVRIGRYAMVAAGAIVKHDVPDWTLHNRGGGLVPIDRTRHIERMRYVD